MGFWTTILDQIVARSGSPPPFVRTMGLPPIDRWEQGRIWARWTVDPKVFHNAGAVFGGFLSALADHMLGLVSMTVLKDDEMISTSDLRVSYFRPVKDGVLEIAAEVIHRGRRRLEVEVQFRQDGKLAAKATATQVLVPMGGE